MPRGKAMNGSGVFARYLDLSPLRGRSRGKVRCIFHSPDRHPSLDVDLERGLFICRACGTGGGVRRFRELVGDVSTIPATARPAPARPRAPINDAHADALRAAHRQAWARPGVLDLYRRADWVRVQLRLIDRARRAAMTAGATARAWRVLCSAADHERHILHVEGLLDELATLIREPGSPSA